MAISEELQRRIAGFTGMNVDPMTGSISNQGMSDLNQMSATNAMDMLGQTKGAISNQEMNMFQQASPSGAVSNEEMQLLQQAEAESGAPFTAEEREMALAQIKQLSKQGEAPYFEQAQQLASFGTGSDTELAHVEPGEVIVPSEFLEDPEFESALEKKFNQFGIPPEAATVGGLPSLNAQTGMGEYGIFKKIGKFLKKVVTPIAKVAQFIPGPWMAPAALISKAATVRDVVRGDANPLALASVFGPLAVGGKLTDNIAGIKAAGDGSFLSGLGSLGGKTLSGIGNAVMNPIDAIRGIPSLLSNANMSGDNSSYSNMGMSDMDRAIALGDTVSTPADAMMDYQKALKLDPSLANNAMATLTGGMTPDQMANMGVPNMGVPNPSNVMDYDQMIAKMAGGMSGQPQTGTQQGQPQTGTQQGTAQQSFLDKLLGGLGGGGTGGLGGLAGLAGAGALAGTLGKLAYDEAKKDKGVQMTPLTSMDATGRYNIEAEIARRMGQQAPNPTEFGLLPAGTLPELSGGRPMQARYGGEVMNYAGGGGAYPNKGLAALAEVAPQVVDQMGFNMGGQVMPMGYNMGGEMMPMNYNMGGRPMMPMAYAEGGNVAMEDFNRMNGVINGEGTETSDEIPAMLSDGEFVMTGQAVRGAGKYEMQAGEGGIMTLIPSLDEDRERGTNLMYSMMDAFAGQATPSQG